MTKDELQQKYIESLKRWIELLTVDGKNTKHMVLMDMQEALKRYEQDK